MNIRPAVGIAAIGSLSMLLLGALVLTWLSRSEIYRPGGWRDEVYGLVGVTATTQAIRDYREGALRLYVLAGENERPAYTGTNDGPFEVWIPQFYPSLSRAHRYSKEQFVEFYNRKMRFMHSHPEKFPRDEEVQPIE